MKTIPLLVLISGLSTQASSLAADLVDQAAVSNASASAASNSLRLNFRGVSLDAVLEYLSDAAGFIIIREIQPTGKIDLWSDQPVSPEEALNLLNTTLLKNGCAAVRRGRTLTIVNRAEANTRSLPVKLGNDPAEIPETDQLVTQVIPVRFTQVSELTRTLQMLVSTRTTMTANESANTIVITDTQANIRRVAQIIKAIDSGAEDFSVVRILRLRNADPTEMVDLITELFPDESRSETASAPIQFGGPGGFPGGPPGFGGPPGMGFGPGSGTSQSSTGGQRLKKGTRVLAVADQRTSSVVVTAPKDLIDQVESVVAQLDASPARKEKVTVFQLKSASPQQVTRVLQALFQKNTTQGGSSRTSSTQTDPLEARASQQNQQNNTGSRTGLGGNSGFGGGSGGGAAGGGGFGGGPGN